MPRAGLDTEAVVAAAAEIADAEGLAAVTLALAAIAAAYRTYALEHPGCYAAGQRAEDAASRVAAAACADVVGCVAAVPRGYDLAGDDAIHAVRIVRSTLHGLVVLETAGGFALPLAVDDTFEHLVAVLDEGLGSARATSS
jgi:hypothetical protein